MWSLEDAGSNKRFLQWENSKTIIVSALKKSHLSLRLECYQYILIIPFFKKIKRIENLP